MSGRHLSLDAVDMVFDSVEAGLDRLSSSHPELSEKEARTVLWAGLLPSIPTIRTVGYLTAARSQWHLQ
jgi:hypothetical protein